MIQELINEFFIKPIIDPSVQGYNLVNTLVYGIILIVIAFFVLFPILDKKKIKFNYGFAIALLGYILIGISLRAINAFHLIEGIHKTPNPLEIGFYTFTPGVWLLVAAITLIGLITAKKLSKGNEKKFHNYFGLIGLIIGLPLALIVLINYVNWIGFFIALTSILIVVGITKILADKLTKTNLMENKLNVLAVTGQAMDSTATAVAISFYSFGEQHPLSNALLNISPLLFIALKITIILVILYLIETEIKKENLRNYIKVFLFILGFATGGASLLKIGLA